MHHISISITDMSTSTIPLEREPHIHRSNRSILSLAMNNISFRIVAGAILLFALAIESNALLSSLSIKPTCRPPHQPYVQNKCMLSLSTAPRRHQKVLNAALITSRSLSNALHPLSMSENGAEETRSNDETIEVVPTFLHEPSTPKAQKLRSRLLKSLRDVSLRYEMIQPNDRIMVCISGGKDSATLLHLLMHLQTKLDKIGTNFEIVAVHLNQMQPGYDNASLVEWLDSLGV